MTAENALLELLQWNPHSHLQCNGQHFFIWRIMNILITSTADSNLIQEPCRVCIPSCSTIKVHTSQSVSLQGHATWFP